MPLSRLISRNFMLIIAVFILLAVMAGLLPTIVTPVGAQGGVPLGITPTLTPVPTSTLTPISTPGPSIPEPATITLLSLGLAGLAGAAFKRRKE